MLTRDQFNQLLTDISRHLDDPVWLSNALISLSTFLISSSEEVAKAQFKENGSALGYMDNSGDKKISATEAEKRAIVETQSEYKQLQLEREGILETINSIKKRVDVLSWEMKNG